MLDANTATRSVGYNARTFTIDGQPEILLSAGIHYFRVPRELWADRIARAKRGGMNTIETYVAWNFHEPEPGAFLWTGDRDLDAFLSECERQGMYVIARPGPYIRAEWDYGGFPAWLQTLPGIAFRTMNRPYLDAVDRWFDALIPVIARHQWTRGGGIILVQAENEYANLKWTRGDDMAADDDYPRYLRDGLIRRGIDVPLITCAAGRSGTVESVNAHNPADQMPDFRTRSASNLEYASWSCWAEGACGYNYYVHHGDTDPVLLAPLLMQFGCYDGGPPLSCDTEPPFFP